MTHQEERRYSDREFALILSRAADLAEAPDVVARSSGGFSLAEMKAIAKEAGIDPLLIERAARVIPVASGESPMVRFLGGPAKLQFDAVIDAKMTQQRAEHALRGVQATTEQGGKGDANSSGISWNSIGFSQVFVNAHSVGERTRVLVTVDRRPASIVTAALGLSGVIVGLVIIENSMPIGAAAYGILATSLGGTLALARMSWAAATRRFRARAAALMDAISRSLIEAGDDSSSPEVTSGSSRQGE